MINYRSPARISRRSRRSSRLNLDVVLVSRLVKFAFFGILACVVIFFAYFLWISRSLPTPGKLSSADVHDSTKITDKNGVVLYSIYKDYNRIYIPLKDIPKFLQDATIATEDKDFYKNQGFSWFGYLRVVKDVILYRRLTGGSTITQQLVKNVLLSPERTPTRKIKELILAVQVDKKFSKDEILEMYLNNIPYGGTAVGIEAAANQYFGKHAKDLSKSESAFLAGLPQSPSYYSPFSGGTAYLDRSESVLRRMREEGIISKNEEERLYDQIKKFKFSARAEGIKAPHFVMEVRKELNEMFGESAVLNGDLVVKTTLDYEIEKKAEAIMKEEIDKLKTYKVGNGAAVVLDPKNGAVLAMVGSKDYFDIDNDGNFNASLGNRQPGSSLKPVIYAASFEKGYTPATLMMDVKTEFPSNDANQSMYTPVNYDGKYRGPVQVRFALANSLNVPAVKMLAKIGVANAMQKAYDMGIENWKPTSANVSNVGLSLVLGGRETTLLQITNAYGVFANKGLRHEPYYISEVRDSKGKLLYKHKDEKGRQVLSQEIAFLISHILLDNSARSQAFGTNSWLVVPGKTVSVKTGTTDEKRDNWTIGYTPSYVVGVWVGNNDNSPMNPAIASGITGATPIWNKIFREILKNSKDEQFEIPDNVEAVEIDALGGGLPVEGQAKRVEYFIKGTEPTASASIYKKIKISKKDDKKLANDDEISHNDYDVRDYVVFEESDPVSSDGKNRWQDAINAWLGADTAYKDDQKYHPPSERSDKKYDGSDNPTPTLSPTP